MDLIQRNKDASYLKFDKYVNYDDPAVKAKAFELTKGLTEPIDKIEKIYFVCFNKKSLFQLSSR